MADGLLLTATERRRLFWLKFAGGAGPSFVLVAIAAALGSSAIAYTMAVFAALFGIAVATTAKKPRGAVIGGIVLLVVLLLFQIVVHWFFTHPIQKS